MIPIPVLALLAAGILAVMWPTPKLDHEPPPNGGIFNPHLPVSDDKLPIDFVSTSPCGADDCGKKPQ